MKLVGLSSVPERPSGGRLIYRFDFRFSGRHLSFRLQLDEILKEAFGLADWELAGPKWLNENVYEVDAIMPQGTTKDDAPPMVQALLRERFGLRYHTEGRDVPANALVVGKRGFPLKAVTATGHPRLGHGMQADGKFHLTATEASIDYLARWLTHTTGRTVLDRTGLTGAYSFDVVWTSDSDPGSPAGDAAAAAAISDQLDLRLQSTKLSARVLVVDSIVKVPSEN